MTTTGWRRAVETRTSVAEVLRSWAALVSIRSTRTLRAASGRLRRGAGFAAVGLTGLVVNLGVMWVLADPRALHVNYLVAAVLSTQLSSTWNFLLIDNLVYRGPKRHTAPRRWLGFLVMSNAVLVLRIPLLALLVSLLGLHYLFASALTLVLGYLVRFRTQERLTLVEKIS